MWSKIGWLMILVGILAFAAIFTGMAPVAIATLGVPDLAWLGLSFAGGIIVMLNRRPSN